MTTEGHTDPVTGRKRPGTGRRWPFGTESPGTREESEPAWAAVERDHLRQARAERRNRVQQLPTAPF